MVVQREEDEEEIGRKVHLGIWPEATFEFLWRNLEILLPVILGQIPRVGGSNGKFGELIMFYEAGRRLLEEFLWPMRE